jgi:predicted NBD/HSP70 family sugar kinase
MEQTADTSAIRRLNRARVLLELVRGDIRSRPELAQRLGLSLMGVMRVVQDLIEAGLVKEGGRTQRPDLPGRRPAELALSPSGGYLLGFGIHAYEQSCAIIDLTGRVLRSATILLRDSRDARGSLAEAADQATTQIRALGIDPARMIGAGVAITGTVEHQRGVVIDAPYLGWSALDVREILQDRLAMPVVVDGTANMLLAAEARNAAQPLRDAILFNIGFAIGGSLLVDGRIVRGANSRAGQIGHMPVAGSRRSCACGRRGCLNTVASGWAALADLGVVGTQVVSADDFRRNRGALIALRQSAQAGEPDACRAVLRAGQAFGRAVRQLHAALDPARIFIAGPIGGLTAFVDGARQGFGNDLPGLIDPCDRALSVAAASLASDVFVFSPRLDLARLKKAGTAAM